MARCSGDSPLASSPPARPLVVVEVTFKPLVPRLSVREGFLALTSPVEIRHLYFKFKVVLMAPKYSGNREAPEVDRIQTAFHPPETCTTVRVADACCGVKAFTDIDIHESRENVSLSSARFILKFLLTKGT
ncbi:hypothetical protein J6590_073366, partial [Homalodisca vitripennis]